MASTRTDVDTASVGLVTIDTDSQAISSCNDAFAELVGRAADDVLGCLITDFVDDEVRPIATAVIEGISAGFISSVDGNVDLLGQAGTVRVDCWILALGADLPHQVAIAGVLPATSTAPPGPSPPSRAFGPLASTPIGSFWRHWTRTGGSPKWRPDRRAGSDGRRRRRRP